MGEDAMLQRLRECVCFSPKYYQDITNTAPQHIKEALNHNTIVNSDHLTESGIDEAVNRLRESNAIADNIVATVISKLRERGVNVGERKIYKVPVGRWDNLNGNKRIYPKKLWENVMNDQRTVWQNNVGLANHPQESEGAGSIKDSAIVWLGMELDDVEKIVYGIGTFVGVFGHLFQDIIDAGGRVGFSSSGFGEIMPGTNMVNPDTYQIERLADVVLNPSQDVYGDISMEQRGLGNIEYTKQQPIHENSNTPNNIKESQDMSKSILTKVEEKAFRTYVSSFIEEATDIKSPSAQLKELQSIKEMFEDGIAPDLKEKLEEKINAKQAELEKLVESAISMKEELGMDSLEEITDGTKRVIEEGVTLASKVESYKKIIEGLTERNRSLRSEIEKLQEANATYEAEKHDIQKIKNSLNKTVKDLSLKLTLKEAEALTEKEEDKKLSKLSEQLNQSVQALRKVNMSKLKSDMDYKKLQDKTAQLEEELNRANTRIMLKERKEEALSRANDSKLVSTRETLDSLKESFNKKELSFQQIIKKYKEGNYELEKRNGILESKIKAANKMLNNLYKSNTLLNDSVKTLKEAALAGKDEFIKHIKESIDDINNSGLAEISLDNDGTLIINNVNAVKANLNTDAACPSCDCAEETDIGSAATDMLDEYAESLSKKRLSQLLNFREADGILIEKYWADQLSHFGESLMPFEHKIRDAKTLAEAQREFFKILPFISNKISSARTTPNEIRQKRLEESTIPVKPTVKRDSMADRFGLK